MIENPVKKMTKILDDFRSKKISMDELQKECAYWFLDLFDEIHPKPLPSIPHRLAEYYNSDDAIKKRTPKEFWFIDEVRNYLEQKLLITQENKDNLWHLKDYLKHIPEGDFLARSKYTQQIREFETKDYKNNC